jgi:hypothetical protein
VMLIATCHCGAVRIEIPRRPRSITNCNCSICRRYGTLWAYYKESEVRVIAEPGATKEYSWGRKALRFVRCAACGCITHWKRVNPVDRSSMGINARNLEPSTLGPVRIRLLDGASQGLNAVVQE